MSNHYDKVRLLAAKNALESLKISLMLMGEHPELVRNNRNFTLYSSEREPVRVYINSSDYYCELGWHSTGTINFKSRDIEAVEQWLFENYFGEGQEGYVACNLKTLKPS